MLTIQATKPKKWTKLTSKRAKSVLATDQTTTPGHQYLYLDPCNLNDELVVPCNPPREPNNQKGVYTKYQF